TPGRSSPGARSARCCTAGPPAARPGRRASWPAPRPQPTRWESRPAPRPAAGRRPRSTTARPARPSDASVPSSSVSDADVLVLALHSLAQRGLPALPVAARVLRLEGERVTFPARRIASDRVTHLLAFEQLRLLAAGSKARKRDDPGGEHSDPKHSHGSAPLLDGLLRAARAVRGTPSPELRALAPNHHALPIDVRQLLAVAAEQRLRRAHLGAHRKLPFGKTVASVPLELLGRSVGLGPAGAERALVHLAAQAEGTRLRELRRAERT